MTDLDMHRLTIGQPDLQDDDPDAAARGLVVGLALGGFAWMGICGLAYLWVWG